MANAYISQRNDLVYLCTVGIIVRDFTVALIGCLSKKGSARLHVSTMANVSVLTMMRDFCDHMNVPLRKTRDWCFMSTSERIVSLIIASRWLYDNALMRYHLQQETGNIYVCIPTRKRKSWIAWCHYLYVHPVYCQPYAQLKEIKICIDHLCILIWSSLFGVLHTKTSTSTLSATAR